MIDVLKTIYEDIAVKLAIFLHFLFEFMDGVLKQPVSDLLRDITSVLSIIFIILKSIETWKNINKDTHANNKE